MDIRTKEWSEKIFDAAGIGINKTFGTASAFEVAGTVLHKRAEGSGLGTKTKVVVGDSDHESAMLGCGLTGPGQGSWPQWRKDCLPV